MGSSSGLITIVVMTLYRLSLPDVIDMKFQRLTLLGVLFSELMLTVTKQISCVKCKIAINEPESAWISASAYDK